MNPARSVPGTAIPGFGGTVIRPGQPGYDAGDEGEIAWARATYAAVRPYLSEGGYVNFMGDDEDDDTAAAYGRTIERLQRIKAAYDPDNVFRLNQNITPAASPQ